MSMKILFIGNSYTFFNEMWNIVKNMAASVNIDVEVDNVVKGGYYLKYMNDENNEFGAKVKEKLDSDIIYDYVFLQEQSCNPYSNSEDFYTNASELGQKFKNKGSKIVMYQTWARKEGSDMLKNLNCTVKEMYMGLRNSYRKVATDNDFMLSPVGDLFNIIVENGNMYDDVYLDLYNPDKSHPSKEGSYLGSLSHLYTMFKINPMDVNYNYDLDEKIVYSLKKVASDYFTK